MGQAIAHYASTAPGRAKLGPPGPKEGQPKTESENIQRLPIQEMEREAKLRGKRGGVAGAGGAGSTRPAASLKLCPKDHFKLKERSSRGRKNRS